MKQRILITGGFGYVGGRIATYLNSQDQYTLRLGSRKKQIAPDWLPQAETVSMDLFNLDSLASATNQVHTVIHLAAMNENECLADPSKAVLVNTLGTRNILQAAIDSGAKRFIYFSTAHVYGAPLIGYISENMLPAPIHPYAITHHGAEDFVLAANSQQKIKGVVIRLSNGFGAPVHPHVDRWTLLVNDLCRQLAETGKMVLRSSGVQKRDFITLEDISRAVGHLLHLPNSEYDGLFNLGGEASLSVLEITKQIAFRCKTVLGFEPEIIRPNPNEKEIVHDLVFDISRLKNTGFSLTGNMNREIDETIKISSKYFHKNHG